MQIVYISENLVENLNALAALPAHGFIWIKAAPEDLEEVAKLVNRVSEVVIDDNHLADARSEDHPPQHDIGDGYEVLIFRHLLPVGENIAIKTQAVAFFILDRMLISIAHPETNLTSTYEQICSSKKRSFRSPEGMVHFIVNKITDQFLKLRPVITEQQLSWQKRLLNRIRQFNDWQTLFDYKNHISQLAFLCEVQQDAVESWAQNMEEETLNRLAVRLSDLKNHITRMLHFTKKSEDEINTLMQLHYAIVSHRTNTIMRLLAAISVIFLPLSFLTGVFGMNFENMPILHWQNGFHATIIFMILTAGSLMAFFKLKKWI